MNYIKPEDIKEYVNKNPAGIAGESKELSKMVNHFAELIVRECIAINKVETTALDLPEYNLGMSEGYRRARENISIHFGVEE